jgi:hypothetical protein
MNPMRERASDCGWERPKTTKLYLHPPLAERIVTVWPDFKVVNGQIKEGVPLNGGYGFGFLILRGDGAESVPWKETVFTTREDGIPIPVLSSPGDGLSLSMECFCSMERAPVTYCRLKVRNGHPWPMESSLSLMPRNGRETYMMGTSIDAYQSYEPCRESWGMLPSDWTFANDRLSNGESEIVLLPGKSVGMEWVECDIRRPFLFKKILRLSFRLEPDGETSVDIAMRRGTGGAFRYEEEKRKTVKGWERELSGITLFPSTDAPSVRAMFLSLTAQCLQMFAMPEGTDHVIPRQGGIVHWIWPWEAAEMTMALDRIGLHDYPEKAYDFFRAHLLVKEGPDKGMIKTMGIDWACQTGSVLLGLSYHIKSMKSRERFQHYRQMLLDCLDYIERTRAKTMDPSFTGVGKGLFPPMKASDWPDEYQSWCWTDLNNLLGLKEMHGLFALFQDDCAPRIEKSYRDYRGIIERILKDFTDGQKDNDEILIPYRLGIPLTDPALYPYHADATNLIRLGLVKPGGKVFRQLEAYFRNRRLIQNGLTGLMQDSYPGDRWCGHTWYLGISDMAWFYGWLEAGEIEKAEETFFAVLKYGMTAEHYMQERYADNDPTYVPWSPNASNNGRVIMMMLDYHSRVEGRSGKG